MAPRSGDWRTISSPPVVTALRSGHEVPQSRLRGREPPSRQDHQRAQALLGDALRLARATHNPRLEASLLGALAGYAFDEGRLSDALWMLRESVRIHAEQGDHLDSAADLSRTARVLAITGHPGTAVRLLASLSALRPEIGGRRALVESITEETVARVRRQLDAATFSSEWHAGQSLTIAEALRLALWQVPRVLVVGGQAARGRRSSCWPG